MAENAGNAENPQGGRAAARRTAQAPQAPAGRRSPLLVASRAAACSVALAVFVSSGVVWYEYKQLTDGMTTSNVIAETKKDAPKHLDNSVNLLLIGLDSRKNMDGSDLDPAFVQDELHAGHSSDIGGYNTNSLILLHIPANGGKVQAVSVPRDDYVMTYDGDGSQLGMAKIKEAYGAAKEKANPGLQAKGLKGADLEKAGRDAGRAATIRTVQKFLDQPIDHIAEVNLMGFYDIAKAVEPIEVCLTHDTKDPAIEGQGSGADFHKGINKLNASQALSFVRQRHNLDGPDGNTGDFARTHRQQAFISSVVHKLKQDGIISDLGKLQKLFGVVQKDLVIDNEWNVLDFAQQAPALTGGNVEFNTLTFDGFGKKNGQDVNLVTPSKVQKVVKQLFGYADAAAPAAPAEGATDAASASAQPTPTQAPTTTAKAATVDVYNASKVDGAADSESKALVAMGFKEGKSGPATTKPKTTTVVYGKGAQDAAEQIAARYGVTATESSSTAAGHVTVTLGTGFTAPAGDKAGANPTTGATPAPSDPAAGLPVQGPGVDAESNGGIPCVY
ncbi:LytR family transcriptional regulator [Streptomyces kaniharaensis]|uniref:LytR family transcriptional regulator n=1 Tax=Streptomyces kaniharaensis TaxID=212423 RepID=A0A6N7KQ11_9ACTN|nr:LCP family protein [Streptomyces kaniharaensis]MQS13662.1 LytR family transcriptional regulator [Streptomyces kaniharaensis]